MRELFEICPKIQLFSTFLVLFEIGGEGEGIWSERCKIKCSDVSGTTWRIPCLSPGKMTTFPSLALFSTCPSQKSGTINYFKITFLNSTRIELSLCEVLF